MSADMIILGSPVYAHNVSGDMKILIDRISYWLHSMKLNKKYAAVISTTESNGHLTVIDYLEKIMCILGCKTLFEINCARFHPDEYYNENWLFKKVDDLSGQIIKALYEPIISNDLLENVFQNAKFMYEHVKQSGKEIDNLNLKESEEIGLYRSTTYQEFLDTHYSA